MIDLVKFAKGSSRVIGSVLISISLGFCHLYAGESEGKTIIELKEEIKKRRVDYEREESDKELEGFSVDELKDIRDFVYENLNSSFSLYRILKNKFENDISLQDLSYFKFFLFDSKGRINIKAIEILLDSAEKELILRVLRSDQLGVFTRWAIHAFKKIKMRSPLRDECILEGEEFEYAIKRLIILIQDRGPECLTEFLATMEIITETILGIQHFGVITPICPSSNLSRDAPSA